MKLEELEITHCTCKECISYCKARPGWFRPGEMPRLAEFLEMPLKEVFKKYLIVDYWMGQELAEIYLLSPVKDFSRIKSKKERIGIDMQMEHNELMNRHCDKAGKRASWGYAFLHAPCIFLKDSKCSIYEARPFECAIAWHEDGKSKQSAREPGWKIRELIMEEWKKSRLIRELMDEL